MTNKYGALRELLATSTGGDWFYQEDSDAYTHIIRSSANPNLILMHGTQSSRGQVEADVRFAAAAHNALPALIDEIDKLRAVLGRCVLRIKTDRDELELCAIDPKTGAVEDQLTRDAIGGYDNLLAEVIGVLSQHQGERYAESA